MSITVTNRRKKKDYTGSGGSMYITSSGVVKMLSAPELLSKLLSVDTDNSGLNANYLQGHDASYFFPATGGEIDGDLHVKGNIIADGGVAFYQATISSTLWDNMPYATSEKVGGFIVGNTLSINGGVLNIASGTGFDLSSNYSPTGLWNFSQTPQVGGIAVSLSSHNHSGIYEPANSNIQTHIASAHQTIINGTGFVKASGTTLSYDNNTYSISGHTHTISNITNLQSALDAKLNVSLKGAANGLAELDSSGKVLSAQLPSYVDDVLEYSSSSNFPATGESGKIYVALDTNLTHRWTGSAYTEISPSIALGETSSTAYRGDRGKIAYDHSQSSHAYLLLAGGTLTGGLIGTTASFSGAITTANALNVTTPTYPMIRLKPGSSSENYWAVFNSTNTENTSGNFAIRYFDGTYYEDFYIAKPTLTANKNSAIYTTNNSNLTTIDWSAKNLTLAGAITGATTGSFSTSIYSPIHKTANFSIEESGSDLVIKYGTTIIAKITVPVSGKSDLLMTGGVGFYQTI